MSIVLTNSSRHAIANSSEESRGKLTGLFWGLFQVSAIVGNLASVAVLVHFDFAILSVAFTVVGVSGCLLMLTLKKPTAAGYRQLAADDADVGADANNSNVESADAVVAMKPTNDESENASAATSAPNESQSAKFIALMKQPRFYAFAPVRAGLSFLTTTTTTTTKT